MHGSLIFDNNNDDIFVIYFNLGRQRTPSGSTTPVRPGQQTAASRLVRRPSDVTDSAAPTTPVTRRTSASSTKTTEKREPFRL